MRERNQSRLYRMDRYPDASENSSRKLPRSGLLRKPPLRAYVNLWRARGRKPLRWS